MTEIDHKTLAINLFNQTWDFLDKQRTVEEDFQMVLIAHASCYHWSQCGTELEQARGEWLISRVHAVLKQGSIALWHAQRSLELCLEIGIGDFDLAFGYEALARAYASLGMKEKMYEALNAAKAAAEAINDEDDKQYTLGEIASIAIE